MKNKFIEFEKKITELTEEIMGAHQTINLKDRDIEELNRRITQSEDDFALKTRTAKNSIEEQLHNAKMQHASELKNQQDEIRLLRDGSSRLEERLKAAMMSEQNKERNLIDMERKYAELSDKVNSVTSQMKNERDTNDRLCLENEDLKRKLNKEEARCRKALEDLKEYDEEMKTISEKPKMIKKVVEEVEVERPRQVRPNSTEEDLKKINYLTKKVADLKENLKFASDKLVKTISDKVILIQRLRDHGISITDLDKPSKQKDEHPIKIIDPSLTENNKKHAQDKPRGTSPCPVHSQPHPHGHHHHHHEALHHPQPTQLYGPQYTTDFVPYMSHPNLDYVPLSHESKTVPGSLDSTPFTTDGFKTHLQAHQHNSNRHGDHYIVDQRTYQANIDDLTEDELQLKIKHLLSQKESFFHNA